MNETHILFTLAGIHWVALMSPGPDFALVVRHTTRHGRKTGLYIAAGLSAGILAHSALSLLGISLLLHQHHLLFAMIQLAGGSYLSWTGLNILRQIFFSRPQPDQQQFSQEPKATSEIKPKQIHNNKQAFMQGFLTNILNPKALVFFVSLMSGLIPADFSVSGKYMAILLLWGLALLWFSLLAWILSTRRIQQKITQAARYIDSLCGLILSAAGLFILLKVAEDLFNSASSGVISTLIDDLFFLVIV
ncbi:Threonine efflux protein [Vibrio aerogenes CECT 7868]|uniref:Threonine efflux protein n=1 Tax=Vibrio aerogenes CECT 7868 TaxID=1216006 RepID=A0A1M6AMI1_9VIBR|nr:LysE family translocator [Vibrio aerogenes]SHI37672.1 Threonine efflux protein [Vibrio aerogenes CECT 7868]